MTEHNYNQLLTSHNISTGTGTGTSSEYVLISASDNANRTTNVNCFNLKNDGLSEYSPISFGWKVILSLIPFVCVFQGVLAYNLSSRYVAPFTLLITVFLGVVFFEDEGYWIAKHDETQNNIIFVFGLVFLSIIDRILWTIFEYAFNVFTAFFFLRVLELWGIIDQMNLEFSRMAPTDNRKVLLILFCFAIMIAVVAPGGSNFLIAGAIMVDLNHRKYPVSEAELAEAAAAAESLNVDGNGDGKKAGVDENSNLAIRDDYDVRIGAICLFGNGLTSAFNLVGVCIIAIAGDIILLSADDESDTVSAEYASKQIGKYFSAMFFLFSLVSPFIMAGIYNRKSSMMQKFEDMKHDFVPMFLCGLVYAFAQLLCAWFIGPELVCLIAAGAALCTYYTYQQCKTYGTGMNGRPNILKRKFLLPFIILVLLLCCIRLIPGLQDAFESSEALNPYVLNIKYFDYSFERHFSWLSHSGTSVFIVSVLTPFIVPYYSTSEQNTNTELDNEEVEVEVETGDGDGRPEQIRVKSELATTELQLQLPRTDTDTLQLRNVGNNLKEGGSHNKKVLDKEQRTLKKEQQQLEMIDKLEIDLMSKRKFVLLSALKKSIGEALPVMVAIGGYASIAKIMAKFNMTQSIAEAIVKLLANAPEAYAAFIPIIGMLGSGLTGSTTTSNFLFGQLQVQTSIDLGLVGDNYNSVWEIAAAQILGATGGEIISPMNAVFSTLLLAGRFPESLLIKMVMKVFLVWMLACIIVSIIFIVPKGFIN